MTKSQILTVIFGMMTILSLGLLASCSVPGGDSVPQAPAEMWQNNCNRCHGFRDPSSLSDKQWAVAMRHMQVRGGLTAEEHAGILEFLQASN